MSVVLVINDVLEINTGLLVQLFEEFLVEDKGHPAYLLDPRLSLCTLVNEIGSDGNREFASKFLAPETLQGIALPVGSDQYIELVLGDWMIGGRRFCPPADF